MSMTRHWATGLALVVLVGWSGAEATAQEPSESRGLLSRLNPFASPDPGPRLRTPVAPLSPESLLAAITAEKEAYSRRLDACHRLRELALDSSNEALEAKANELEKMATETYRLRVSRLGVPSGAMPLSSGPVVAASATDTLNKQLGTGVATNPLASAAKKPTDKSTATAKANTFKEVNP
jgi:hypothetical protein